jgi:threonine/homoserine/homoserine lactone efflux protein
MQEVYDRSVARTSFTLVMLGIASAMALVLGIIGIYGVISYSVSQRRREFGIRVALGAHPGRLLKMVLRQAAKMALAGVVIGMGVMMFLVAFGLGHVVLASPALFQILKWGGIGFLLWLSWKIATAGRSDATINKRPLGFWGAAAFQWINPKSWLVNVSAVSTFLHPEAGTAFVQAMGLGTLFIIAAFPSCFIWLAFGASLQRFLRTEQTSRIFNVAMGTLLAGAVLLFIW